MKVLSAVILAAGEGKRMKSSRAKVLHEICGIPMLGWVLKAVDGLTAEQPILVVGKHADSVTEYAKEKVRICMQEQQLGTGHAVMTARSLLEGRQGYVFIIAGDMPLMKQSTLEKLSHAACGNGAALLSCRLPDPTGYGRIIKDSNGYVERIVEHRDANPAELQITEVNSSIYCFNVELLLDALDKLDSNNSQGEYYLTDCIGLIRKQGHAVVAVDMDPIEGMGVNDMAQLAKCQSIMRSIINARHMALGVCMIDPEHTYIDESVVIGPDTHIYPDVVLQGNTQIGEGTVLYPGCRIKDSIIGNNCTLQAVVSNQSRVGNNVTMGPFVNLRPGTVLADNCKVGDFIEIKNSTVGEGSKLPHLSYIGDADIGKRINMGCGAVIVNFDGYNKHRTKIGDDAFIGCNTNLVAPVTVEEGAYTAAGSTITKDVPPYALGVARARQENKLDWAHMHRARNEKRD